MIFKPKKYRDDPDFPFTGGALGFWCKSHADGVLVVDIHPQSPLVDAGLVAGDLIVEVCGKCLSKDELLRGMKSLCPGTLLSLHYSRYGRVYPVEVRLAAREKFEESGIEKAPSQLGGEAGFAQDSASEGLLLGKLSQIIKAGWVDSMRIGKDGIRPYRAQNGVGYTLEALLGISPNGYSAPDYLGWELKALTVNSFARDPAPSKAISLMTPEPDGGVYVSGGLAEFLSRWGYWKDGRQRFTGRYRVGEVSTKNEMKLTCPGVDDIALLKGNIKLVDKDGVVAASWSLTKLLDHWKRKHSQAAYLMAEKRDRRGGVQYRYHSEVFLGEGARKSNFFESIKSGRVYYDPAPYRREDGKFKKRSQFRIAFKDLASMYENFQKVDILEYPGR